ncbi:RNA polymerase sigma factor [Prevotellamassilia timonensis]|uniref:RNA polymerase sigma factor n=1 Tax=Prevotellamassilia timonensis TaxID=1852370 RepID=UPI001D6CFBB2|nr:sigma-70 family RNA polymerase sigma factor [Prevotellamassilia timonensis]MBS7395228.1 sigma-70 family RNA polymerase sigma factor [Prevotellamassilia sp.]MCF2635577.1 sigma-70 family RNA polymerase sigma factor [Prevotellamassilia timonensis]MCI5508756.1 sigma-70 family RNA polymerase sigma factor [Bacteroidales bacterium]
MTPEELHTAFLSHAARLLAQAQRYVVSADEAQDILQDAFEALWKRRERLAEVTVGEAYPYFSSTVRNLSLNRLRDLNRMEFGVEENLDVTVTPSPETLLMGRERVERLQRLVNSLPEKQSRAFTLFHFDGLETAEIARAMGETESYVRLLLSRARKEVKSRID